MKRLLSVIGLCALVVGVAQPAMATLVSLPYNWVNGQIIDANQIMAQFNAPVNVINGGIDHTNVNQAVGFYSSDIKPSNFTQSTAGGSVAWIFPNGLRVTNVSASSLLCTDINEQLTTLCGSIGGYVTSITGTANQVTASAATGAVTLSLPQNINSGAAPTFAGTNFTSVPNAALTNSSVTVAGTANRVTVLGCGPVSLGGTCTLSGPQDIGTSSNVTFGSVTKASSNLSGAFINIGTSGTGGDLSLKLANDSGSTLIQTVHAGGPNVVQTCTASELLLQNTGVTNDFAVDTTGNACARGDITAATFHTGSRRDYKTDWHPFTAAFDPFSVIDNTTFGTYRYKSKYGDPSELRVGYLADQTPALLSGPQHAYFDAQRLASVEGVALQRMHKQVNALLGIVRVLCSHRKQVRECAALRQ